MTLNALAPSTYNRIALKRPRHLPDEQWNAIAAEAARVESALERDDSHQAIGSLKDLLESIARCVKELNGEPAAPSSDFPQLLQSAHELLRAQPGRELARKSRHARIANSAATMARLLAETRNDLGTGHGRAAVPDVSEDELTLVLDASLTWARWALRRLGLFCIGRPDQIIESLEHGIWRKHELSERLAATDLSSPETARQVGLAVGRRAATDTWNVFGEGIEAPAASGDVVDWPPAYRWAASTGLLFSASGATTVNAQRLLLALELLRPLLDGSVRMPEHPWNELVTRIEESSAEPIAPGDWRSDELTNLLGELTNEVSPAREGAQRIISRFDLD